MLDRLTPSVDTGIVLFGGRAKDAPYPGSTTVSTINGGVDGLMNALALERAPSGSTPCTPGSSATARSGRRNRRASSRGTRRGPPGGKLATVADVVGAVKFLLFNRGVSAHSLNIDRGWRIS